MNITVRRRNYNSSNWLSSSSYSSANKEILTYNESCFVPDISHYEIGPAIGKSSFGSGIIYACKFTDENEFVAIKKYDLESVSTTELGFLLNELDVLGRLRHSCVISVLTSFVVGSEVLVAFPLMVYRSCTALITNHFHTGLPEVIIRILLKDILNALVFIHNKGVIHRAIKASHILIGLDGCAKLSGFRYAYQRKFSDRFKKVFDYSPSNTSNLRWLSPDILQQDLVGYDEKSDVYSLGITVCELANGFVPYLNIKFSAMLIKKIDGCIPLIYDVSTLDKLQDISDEELVNVFYNYYSNRRFSKHLHSFKDLCCIRHSHERPGAAMLLLHSLISKPMKTKTIFSQLVLPALPITKNFSAFNGDSQYSDTSHKSNQDLPTFTWDF